MLTVNQNEEIVLDGKILGKPSKNGYIYKKTGSSVNQNGFIDLKTGRVYSKKCEYMGDIFHKFNFFRKKREESSRKRNTYSKQSKSQSFELRKVIAWENNDWRVYEIEDFIKSYGLVPKHTGKEFFTVHHEEDSRDLIIVPHPNNAVVFEEGKFKYAIPHPNEVRVINGCRMPSGELLEEWEVFSSQEDFVESYIKNVQKYNYVKYPDGKVVKVLS